MRTFVVERYVPRPTVSDLRTQGERVTAAVRELEGFEGAEVVYLRSIYIPDDEVSFCLFRSPSAEAIAEGFTRAQIAFERVLEAEVLEP
jgi:hypothetical protein